MKMMAWVLIVLIVTIAILIAFRFDVDVSSPVVVKLDRLTGKTWVVNAGEWREIGESKPAQGSGTQAKK